MGNSCTSNRRRPEVSPAVALDDLSEIDKALRTRDLEQVGPDLGKGSFGKVIRVEHLTDSREYAVKMIVTSEKNKNYQERELEILATCPHENIVKYYDSWRYNSKFPILYIRMELCSKNLETLLLEQERFVDEPHYLRVFPQILRGLEFIHGKQWVHRDINPLNILIAMQDTLFDLSSLVIKLADFGLARRLDEQPSLVDSADAFDNLSLVGNELYRAPEMQDQNSYDYKVDVYSAGLVLYRLCRRFNDTELIAPELEAVRKHGPAKSNMTHSNEFLLQMLNDLLTKNPNERPSASDALKRFEKEISRSTTHVVDSSEEEPDIC